MSESAPTYHALKGQKPPVYIACAAGGNVQTECAVSRSGDLVRIVGHGQMDFCPHEALTLACAVALRAVECGCRDGDELARMAEFWLNLARQCGYVDLDFTGHPRTCNEYD